MRDSINFEKQKIFRLGIAPANSGESIVNISAVALLIKSDKVMWSII